MSLVLITGATAGIGEATAKKLAQRGHSLWITGRRQNRLSLLAEELASEFQVKIETFCFDVQDRKEVDQFLGQVRSRLPDLDVLINNAGLAKGIDKIQDARVEDWEQMIDTNLKGLLYLTRGIVGAMIARKAGMIVNVGSVGGRWVYPGGVVYCATKFAVRAISEGLRMDLAGSGVRVCNIEPGMVETDFSLVRLGDAEAAKAVYRGMKPLTAMDIAESIHWVISQPVHVNIQELVIFPTDQAAVGQVSKS